MIDDERVRLLNSGGRIGGRHQALSLLAGVDAEDAEESSGAFHGQAHDVGEGAVDAFDACVAGFLDADGTTV